MSKANTKHRIHVILTKQQYEGLTKRSEETGAPLSELIRRALDSALSSREKAGKGAK